MIATTGETIKQPTSVSRQRGCLFYIKRGLIALAILLVGIPALGMTYQMVAEASDRQAYPAPGQMVNVDGHMIHLHCTGEGEPTIILEAGAFSFSSEWYWVQQQMTELVMDGVNRLMGCATD
jgi:hypothetical protein